MGSEDAVPPYATVLQSGLLCLVLAGCAPQAPSEPLQVVATGCASWSPTGACEHLPGTQLQLWTDVPSPVHARTQDRALTVTSTPSGLGQRLTIDLPKAATRLQLRSLNRGTIVSLSPIATSTPSAPKRRQARAWLHRARAALRGGALDLSLLHLSRSASVARAANDESQAREADLLASFIDVVLRGEVRDASERMRRLARPPAVHGRGRVLDHFHRGLVAARTARAREGLQELAQAELWAQRLDSPYLTHARHERARLLMDLGRTTEAARIFDAMLQDLDERLSCDWAAAAVSAGWARVVARPPIELDIASRYFRQAEAIYAQQCPRPADANNARVNLAFVAAKTEPATAGVHLARVRGPEQPESRAWRQALLGQLHFDAGRLNEARQTYLRLVEMGERISLAPLQWQALVGLGRVARARGGLAKARQHFEAAERVLASQGELVPMNRGRRFLLEDRSQSLRLLIATHLDAGQPADALAALRRARRRTARAIAARDALDLLSPKDRLEWSAAMMTYQRARAEVLKLNAQGWQVARAEAARLKIAQRQAQATAETALDGLLRTVAPSSWFEGAAENSLPEIPKDTLVLAPFFTPDDRRLFIARGDTVIATQLKPSPDTQTWASLLAPHLSGVRQIRVIADPGTLRQQLRRAMWRGAALGTQIPIAYTLDLGPAPARSQPAKGSLVVFDPLGDLADARDEGQQVAEALGQIAGPVRTLGPLQATPKAVTEALAHTRIFHFAGHGEYRGPQGWQSALRLSEGTLDLGDLLTLPAPPRWVVLSGCETAKTTVGLSSAGMGLAQVLLAAGSEAVIATSAPVDSGEARAFSKALYASLVLKPDLPSAFAAALARLKKDGVAWHSFLLLTRSP